MCHVTCTCTCFLRDLNQIIQSVRHKLSKCEIGHERSLDLHVVAWSAHSGVAESNFKPGRGR